MVDSTQTQIRRGTQGQIEGFVPVEGEVIYDQTNQTLRPGDGTRPGGFMMPNGFHIQNQYFTYAEDTGSENALVADLPLAPLTLTMGLGVKIRVAVTNTGESTLNLNSLGAVGVRKVQAGTLAQLAAGDLSAGIAYDMTYDGTYFVMSTAGGLQAPVAGSTYNLYVALSPVADSTSATDFPPLDYQNYIGRSWNVRVNVSGSVRVWFQHRGTGTQPVRSSVFLNRVSQNSWTTTSGTYQTRTIDLAVSAGNVITVATRHDGGTLSVLTRSIIIQSETPSHGAVSG